jgi:hypothetical protein
MARATALLVALAASTCVAATIEGAVIAEPVVGAVDGLPGRSESRPSRHDGVMETLIRVTAGATERRLRMVCRRLHSPQHCKHGGDRDDRCAQQPSPRVSSGQHPGQTIKSPFIHQTHLQTRVGRTTWSAYPGSPTIRAVRR